MGWIGPGRAIWAASPRRAADRREGRPWLYGVFSERRTQLKRIRMVQRQLVGKTDYCDEIIASLGGPRSADGVLAPPNPNHYYCGITALLRIFSSASSFIHHWHGLNTKQHGFSDEASGLPVQLAIEPSAWMADGGRLGSARRWQLVRLLPRFGFR